jgi:bifunctional DNA-binding transcriptional regulator/antitoxin component of YhaV-PrlF toxin-antitoxin module
MNKGLKFDDAFYGSATVGERGQIVIPAEARAELGLTPGDKC